MRGRRRQGAHPDAGQGSDPGGVRPREVPRLGGPQGPVVEGRVLGVRPLVEGVRHRRPRPSRFLWMSCASRLDKRGAPAESWGGGKI